MLNYIISKTSHLLINRSQQWQLERKLDNLSLWNLKVNEHGHIAVEGFDIADIIKQYGSPLLVVNQNRLLCDAREIISALTPAPDGSKILYSYKTNCIPGLLREIHNLGIGAEVISPYELWLAEQLHVPGNMIVYNGVNKTEESINRAIDLNILAINIDHKEEIERIYNIAKRYKKKVRVGIRLGLIPKSQFGFEIENNKAMEACKQIAALSEYLELNCIHFNVTTNARSALPHKYYVLKALQFCHALKQNVGIDISYLDIGGGFGSPTSKNMSSIEYALYRAFGCYPKPPDLDDFQSIDLWLSEIITAIKESCQQWHLQMPKILIEPGRYITSRAEFLLATVLTVKTKRNGLKFAITDAGRLSITFPCDFEYHEVLIANRKLENNKHELYHVMGRVCASADWMFKNRYLPELKSGDVLIVLDAGAYFSSFSTNFSFPRPAIVMISEGNSKIIRTQETFEYLTTLDKDWKYSD
jgi:diaminopimelate decarboxylase